MLEGDIDVDAAACDAGEHVFAEAGFQFSKVAGHEEDDLALLAVDGRGLDADHDLIGGMGAPAESGHAVHGRRVISDL